MIELFINNNFKYSFIYDSFGIRIYRHPLSNDLGYTYLLIEEIQSFRNRSLKDTLLETIHKSSLFREFLNFKDDYIKAYEMAKKYINLL